jgi:hypothetical protein
MNGLLPGSGSNKVRALQVVGLALLLAIIVALTYREAPGNEFHFDDHRNIVDYGPVRMEQPSGKALLDAFANPKLQYRNFPSLTFAVDWWRGGGEARAFLQTNVFLHALTALAVFAFAYRLLCRLQTENRRTVLLAAFCVALLWAVHPINSQAVNLIVQRMAILATLFVLLSLTCYLEARLPPRHSSAYSVHSAKRMHGYCRCSYSPSNTALSAMGRCLSKTNWTFCCWRCRLLAWPWSQRTWHWAVALSAIASSRVTRLDHSAWKNGF